MVIATGPAHGAIIDNQPYLRNLALKGLIGLDPTGLGLHCDRQSRLLDQHGAVTPGLLVAGPLARGTFGELMGLPRSRIMLATSPIIYMRGLRKPIAMRQ